MSEPTPYYFLLCIGNYKINGLAGYKHEKSINNQVNAKVKQIRTTPVLMRYPRQTYDVPLEPFLIV